MPLLLLLRLPADTHSTGWETHESILTCCIVDSYMYHPGVAALQLTTFKKCVLPVVFKDTAGPVYFVKGSQNSVNRRRRRCDPDGLLTGSVITGRRRHV